MTTALHSLPRTFKHVNAHASASVPSPSKGRGAVNGTGPAKAAAAASSEPFYRIDTNAIRKKLAVQLGDGFWTYWPKLKEFLVGRLRRDEFEALVKAHLNTEAKREDQGCCVLNTADTISSTAQACCTTSSSRPSCTTRPRAGPSARPSRSMAPLDQAALRSDASAPAPKLMWTTATMAVRALVCRVGCSACPRPRGTSSRPSWRASRRPRSVRGGSSARCRGDGRGARGRSWRVGVALREHAGRILSGPPRHTQLWLQPQSAVNAVVQCHAHAAKCGAAAADVECGGAGARLDTGSGRDCGRAHGAGARGEQPLRIKPRIFLIYGPFARLTSRTSYMRPCR